MCNKMTTKQPRNRTFFLREVLGKVITADLGESRLFFPSGNKIMKDFGLENLSNSCRDKIE